MRKWKSFKNKRGVGIRTVLIMSHVGVALASVWIAGAMIFGLTVFLMGGGKEQMGVLLMAPTVVSFMEMYRDALAYAITHALPVASLLAIIPAVHIGNRLSRLLKQTADATEAIRKGDEVVLSSSHIREMEQLKRNLTELDSRLKMKAKSRKSVVDEMTHQSRTPLTILSNQTEALQDGIIPFSTDELDIIGEQTKNLINIIDNMTNVLDAESSDREPRIENVEIGRLVSKIVDGLRSSFKKKEVLLVLSSESEISLRTDPYLVSQAVYNVISNALKYTKSGGSVDVSVAPCNGGARICVKDTGIGINAQEKDHIFEAFWRAENVSGVEGEGLGLFIAFENLEKVGSTIKVESAPDTGSRFTLDVSPFEEAIKS